MDCADDVRVAYPLFQEGRGGSTPTSALQLKVLACDAKLACRLNKQWHSRFPIIHWSNVVRNKDSVCFVADCEGIYYAVAIWSSPIAANRLKNGESALELRRLAIAPDAPKNTASRMLRVMRILIEKKMPHIATLISYQDTEVHAGTIYKASGWTAVCCNNGSDWTTTKRKRSKVQSSAPKVRWELKMKNPDEQEKKAKISNDYPEDYGIFDGPELPDEAESDDPVQNGWVGSDGRP